MLFKVMNRLAASEYSKNSNIPKTIIISITDIGSSENTFALNNQIIDILRLQFFDCEVGDIGHITKIDSKKIIEFVNKHINDIEQIVVHCEGGISRSAGVCAALMKIINGDDWEIFNNAKYCPNMTCYKTILETYFESYDETEANKKLAHNIKIWRKANNLDCWRHTYE